MRDMDPDIKARLVEGRYLQRDAVLFDFAEGVYGFWWGEGPITWNGITFVGAGRLLEIAPIQFGGDMPAELSVKLSAIPDAGLTPDVLGTVEEYTYHLRPALAMRFYFHPDTGAMVGSAPEVLFRGQVDQISHIDEPGGPYQLEMRLVSRSVDYRKSGGKRRGTEVQSRIAGAVDLGYEHAATTPVSQVSWGQG